MMKEISIFFFAAENKLIINLFDDSVTFIGTGIEIVEPYLHSA